MKIPSKLPITAEQSRATRFQLGLTQANVIEQGELPGHKLKNFETGRFIPDMAFLQSLREFYEDRGIDFNDTDTKQTGAELPKPVSGIGIVTPMQASRFVVDPTLPQERADSILERMDSNDVRIAELMSHTMEGGMLSSYSAKTDTDTKELFGLMAENYLLFRMLQGRNILIPRPEQSEPKTQADLISGLFSTVALLNDQSNEESEEGEIA
ncbi:MAG TPA: hypothetical protein VMV48_00355 [Gallionellaceae bacterium]|nr:hypothetical protein [Gallionellaceae bacterium]